MSTTTDLWLIALAIVAFVVAVGVVVLADSLAHWLKDMHPPNDFKDPEKYED